MTFAVVNRCDDFRELEEDFTLVTTDADAFAARHATWTPITGDEAVEAKEGTFYSSSRKKFQF